jgi:cytidylate kinase
MAVITISREYGSRGEQIAQRVAQDLGYSYFDKDILAEVARAANMTEEQISRYDERDEHGLRGFLKKLFLPDFSRYLELPSYYYPSEFLMEYYPVERQLSIADEPIPTREEVLAFFQHVIEKLWKRDNVVIVGRGSQMILAGKPNTLHVRFIAPIEDRIKQIMDEEGITHPKASKGIETIYKQRAHYIKQYYDADWTDAMHYDLVLNTGSMHTEQAAGIIATAIRHQENQRREPEDGPIEGTSSLSHPTSSDSPLT